MKVKKEAGYFNGYSDEESGDVGVEIYGKDVILLNAPIVRLSPDTPLLTEAQDVAGAINELFQSGTGGGDDWTPPEDWLPVPEPGNYEINLLVDIVDVSSSNYTNLGFTLSRPVDANTGCGPLTIDWGDGTIQTWLGSESGESWSNTDTLHTYSNIGQYVVKIIATAESCFLQQITPNSGYSKVLIAKLGNAIIVNNDDISGGTSHMQNAFYYQYRVHYAKLSGQGGLPRNHGFHGCCSLQKIDISIPPKIIPSYTFADCFNLKNFDFSEVECIQEFAIRQCSFNRIDAPKCTTIELYGLSGCYELYEVNVPKCVTVGNNGFYYDIILTNAVFADECTFGTNCFTSCYNFHPRPDGSTT